MSAFSCLCHNQSDHCPDLLARLDRAEQRVAGLEAALTRIRDEVDHIGRDHAFDTCNEIARLALTPPPVATVERTRCSQCGEIAHIASCRRPVAPSGGPK